MKLADVLEGIGMTPLVRRYINAHKNDDVFSGNEIAKAMDVGSERIRHALDDIVQSGGLIRISLGGKRFFAPTLAKAQKFVEAYGGKIEN